VIAPENGFALYFLGYLQNKLNGHIAPRLLERLGTRLETSDYWADRFSTFELSLDDLVQKEFRNKHIPPMSFL
jgi:hypothetical protein